MKLNNAPKTSFWEVLKRFFSSLFGVNEALFLTGLAGLFYGIMGLWSIYAAFAVCGFLLMAVAVGGIVFAGRKTGD